MRKYLKVAMCVVLVLILACSVVACSDKTTVANASIKANSFKRDYLLNEKLDLSNAWLVVNIDDVRTEIQITENMVSGFGTSALADNATLTVTYSVGKNSASAIWHYNVIDPSKPDSKGLLYKPDSDGNGYIVSAATERIASLTGVVIPSAFNGKPVKEIAIEGFYKATSLQSVTLPDSLTTIGYRAFAECPKLMSIIIPLSVTKVSSDVFYNDYNITIFGEADCQDNANPPGWATDWDATSNPGSFIFDMYFPIVWNYKSQGVTTSGIKYAITSKDTVTIYDYSSTVKKVDLDIPSAIDNKPVTLINGYSFYKDMALTSVTIPNSVTRINQCAFRGCANLTTVYIPNSVITIGDRSFYDNANLLVLSAHSSKPPQWADPWIDSESNVCWGIRSIATASNGIKYALSADNTAGIYGYTGSASELTINDKIENCSVISIYNNAFKGCATLTTISLPSGLASIGKFSFDSCANLANINIPRRINKIDDSAFKDCAKLEKVFIPNSNVVLKSYVFSGCAKLKIFCNPTTLPNSWSNLWDYENDSPVVWDIQSIGETAEKTLYAVGNNSQITIAGYSGNATTLSIPSTIESCAVTTIAERAFENNSVLTSIFLPNSIKTINRRAFSTSGILASVVIPGNVTNIKSEAFTNSNATLYFEVTEAGNWSYNWKDKNVTAIWATKANGITNNGLQYIISFDNRATLIGYQGNETALVIPSAIGAASVTEIADKMISDNDVITSIFLPATITNSRTTSFRNCPNLIIYCEAPKAPLYGDSYYDINGGNYPTAVNISSIGETTDGLIYGVTKDNTITITGYKGANTTVTIPSTIDSKPVTTICNNAFYEHKTITSIVLPSSISSINNDAFRGCTALVSIIMPDGVTKISDSLFYNCSSLTSITLPSALTSIGSYAFSGCTALVSMSLPSTLTSIGENAFRGCTALAYMSLPNTLTSIGSYAFDGCTALASMDLQNGLTSIGSYAFNGCIALASITLPNTLTTIGNYVFSGCRSLTSVTLPNALTSIGDNAFSGCVALASISLPNTLTTIGSYAFSGCVGLNSIIIPLTVTQIATHAFNGCSKLTINCRAASEPTSWAIEWNFSYCTVNWNYKG